MKEAIILCGGKGMRLYPITVEIPKALVDINGKTLIDRQIEWLKSYGVEKIILACGHRWEKLKEHIEKKYSGKSDTEFVYSVEEEPLGTGGAIKKAMENVENVECVVLNVDDMNDVDLNKLYDLGPNAVCLSQLRSPFGIVHFKDGWITKFEQKPLLKDVWVNIGVYLLRKDLMKILPEKGAIETEVFPKIKLKAYKHTGFWVTVNTKKDIEEAEKLVR
jgi:NDP-sugar pyrophosphorylase family protein